ncbi:MAG: type II 3-dehydroquinate dehydratase [Clostridia bacterium]|nr:type II 3-dehydroquinate dehydratase [Clostridia bacterium]
MKILVVNGPNINMLGVREPNVYGVKTFAELEKCLFEWGKECGVQIKSFQSNHEGAIIDELQSALGSFDGIIINPAGYTHTSVAILDALRAVHLPTVEVHLTDISAREDYRKVSLISTYAEKVIVGKGFDGYRQAIEYLTGKVES